MADAAWHRWYLRRKLAGTCVRCSRPAREDALVCVGCKAYQTANTRARRARAKLTEAVR